MSAATDLIHAPPAWSGVAAAVGIDPADAVERLPGAVDQDPFERLALAFLVGYPRHSARAYLGDLKAWHRWCAALGIHPFDARRHHVDAWIRTMTTDPLPRSDKPMNPSSIARRLSAVSKFYKYGIEVEVLTYSPVDNVRRPKVTDETTSVGLSSDELVKLLEQAEAHSPRFSALVSLLTFNGVRIDEALATNVSDYSFQRGHRVLRITRKGGKTSAQPLAPPAVRAIDAYLAQPGHPGAGPLFLDRTYTERLAYTTAFAQIRRLARRAGIPAAEAISPHSFRHAFVTEALAAGIPLQDVQDAAGHADPRVTRRYDRSRLSLDRHPTYVLARHLRRHEQDSESMDDPTET